MTEKALHRLCRERQVGLDAGYEGNAQSFRILTKLSVRSERYTGLNLSRATLNAVLKYPWLHSSVGRHSTKWGAYPEEKQDFEWARAGREEDQRTIEAELMNFADDVAYSIHDAEDFYRAGLIPMELLGKGKSEFDAIVEKVSQRTRLTAERLNFVAGSCLPFMIERRYSGTARQRAELREWTSTMIQRYIQAVEVRVDDARKLFVPENIREEISFLKSLTWEYVIESPALASQQMGHEKIIERLFEAYSDATSRRPSMLPPRFQDYLAGRHSEEIFVDLTHEQRRVRTVADVIANMTDTEATRTYRRLYGLSLGSLSDGAPM